MGQGRAPPAVPIVRSTVVPAPLRLVIVMPAHNAALTLERTCADMSHEMTG